MHPFLLAMQAAGMIIDWYGSQQQKEIGRMGTRLEQAGIENAIQANRLEAEDASLKAMQNLRKNLGTQAAILAARGTFGGAGSALAIRTESIGNFNSDERTRRINTLGKETNLRAQNLMSSLHQLTYETQLGQQMRQRAFNSLPASSFGGGDASPAKGPAGGWSGSSSGTKSFGINDIKSLQG